MFIFKLGAGLTDRILFALALIIGMQLPEFITQYAQRFGGYHQALKDSLMEYQRNADMHYEGSLDRLIADLKASSSAGIRDMGSKVGNDLQRERRMREGVDLLNNGSLMQKVAYLARHLDRPLAEGTWQAFKPGLPLTTDALACGLVAALLASGLFNFLIFLVQWIRKPRYVDYKQDFKQKATH
jgi:hypothetical protein